MPQGRSKRAPRVRIALVGLGALVTGAGLPPGLLLAQQPPSGNEAWQRQQPSRERTQDLLREHDAGATPAERRRELRTLNELHRELMPPGTNLPAPGVAPASGSDPKQGARRRD